MILVIDNYDSFVHNLARYLRLWGQETCVKRNDHLDVDWVLAQRPEAIVLSPGPKAPRDAGASLSIVQACHRTIPILGICLGHQVIVEALGGTVVRSLAPVHGRASQVEHTGRSVFAGLPSPLSVGRYHSLCASVETLPTELEVTAWLPDGMIMGVAHRAFPVVGLQFHPESVLTEQGGAMLGQFLVDAGLSIPADACRPRLFSPQLEQQMVAGKNRA